MTIKEKFSKKCRKNLLFAKNFINKTELSILRIILYPIVFIVGIPYVLLYGGIINFKKEIKAVIDLDKKLSKWAKDNSIKYE